MRTRHLTVALILWGALPLSAGELVVYNLSNRPVTCSVDGYTKASGAEADLLFRVDPGQRLDIPPSFRSNDRSLTREPLDLLAERRHLEIHPQMLEEIRSHREKDYSGAANRGQHMQLGFLNHGLMISRMHFVVEMACRKSGGVVALEAWCQGGQIAGHKAEVPKVRSSRHGGELFWQEVDETERVPVEPDALFTLRFKNRPEDRQLAHFFYEADRGTMVLTDMLRKLRGYHHFIKKQQRNKEAFGIHPIRAVLVETTDEARGKRLMELVNHPLVAGPAKRAGLFWFSISPLFTDPLADSSIPRYLHQPDVIFEPIWALPDRSLHALSDAENTQPAPSQASPRLTNSDSQL